MESSNKKYVLLPYQQRFVQDKSKLKIWLASRQIGKSFALALDALTEALSGKCANLLLSSSERQSKEIMQKVYLHMKAFEELSDNAIKAERESRQEIELPNGSRIIALPANPDTVRGFSGNVYLDEFAFHSDAQEIWRAMYPTVTRGFKVCICSTANGMSNMYYDIWSRNKEFSKHETDIYKAVKEGLTLQGTIDDLEAGINDSDAWAQEYRCKFLDAATAFIPYGLIGAAEHKDTQMEWDPLSLHIQGDLYLGVDIGRKKDLTVFWIMEKVGDVFWTRGVKEIKNASFTLQRDLLYSIIPFMKRACIDSTGLGMQLAEEARERFGPRVEPVVFTLNSKEDMSVTLKRSFEDRQLRIPATPEIREDIHSMKRLITSSGNVRFDAARTEDGHADRFWALALAVHAGSNPSAPISYEGLGVRTTFSNSNQDEVNHRKRRGEKVHQGTRSFGKGCF